MIVNDSKTWQINTTSVIVCGILLLSSFSFYFFQYQLMYPPCCDANSYIAIAQNIIQAGLLEAQIPLRTFMYPLVLSQLIMLSDLSNTNVYFLIFLSQYLFYVCAILYAYHFFSKIFRSKIAPLTILIVLSCNIYLAPYFSIPLTDSLYVSICLFVFINITSLFLDKKHNYLKVFITVFLVSCAIVIRPTAIWLLGPLILTLIVKIMDKELSLPEVAIIFLLALTPLFLQIWINYSKFNSMTFLPASDLGSAQISWGIEQLKYGTWLGGGPPQNFYPANKLIEVPLNRADLNISWYFSNIVEALKLVIVKFVGAFDFDYLVPYPHHKNPNAWLFSIISFAFMFFGICGVIYHAITNNITSLGHRFLPCIIFVSWGSVTLISAIELRFTLPILTYFMIVSVLFIFELKLMHRRRAIIFSACGFLILLPFLVKIASFVREQSTIAG